MRGSGTKQNYEEGICIRGVACIRLSKKFYAKFITCL